MALFAFTAKGLAHARPNISFCLILLRKLVVVQRQPLAVLPTKPLAVWQMVGRLRLVVMQGIPTVVLPRIPLRPLEVMLAIPKPSYL
ncbi:MAG: hypothetical protein CL534_11335 [Ahrensia sp.]|nr:hypothetical protein [Ahrensia sp.]